MDTLLKAKIPRMRYVVCGIPYANASKNGKACEHIVANSDMANRLIHGPINANVNANAIELTRNFDIPSES